MAFSENKFFRNATTRICGTLDINHSLKQCAEFLTEHIPITGLFLYYFETSPRVMNVLTHFSFDKSREIVSPISMPAETIPFIKWPEKSNVRPINDPKTDPIAAQVSKSLNLDKASFLALRLAIDEKPLMGLTIYSAGKNRYSQNHAYLLSLLYEPFAIALSNAFQHEKVKNLMEMLNDDNQYLNKELLRFSGDKIIGDGNGLNQVMESVRQVAPLDSTVLLLGETGVGKEVVANAIHSLSNRNNRPFIKVNCGAIPEYLIDSELFGYEKGAFTGATARKRGRFERAHQGTILLDEIGDLPSSSQIRLLRVLQNKEFDRVGGSQPVKVNVRIIAATHRNLEEMVRRKKFREDLWYRLNVFPVLIPPLRERKEDIPSLVHHFIEKRSKDLKIIHPPDLEPGALSNLNNYQWPGNVRELENMVERALIENRGKQKGTPLSFKFFKQSEPLHEEREFPDLNDKIFNLDELISMHIRKILKQTNGKISGPGSAAEVLGLNSNTLRSKMRKLGIPHGRQTMKESAKKIY